MQLFVDQAQRNAKMRAHTATHLLHALLTTYFPNTKQAGSLVDSDFLRFDFYADTLLTSVQVQEIEKRLNAYIYDSLPVTTIETTFEEAKSLGAKAFFEDKYGDVVRLVRIFQGDKVVSAELCGGTHVTNTKEIGAFTIVSQEAVASGIKRITAFTGPKVLEKMQESSALLEDQVQLLKVKSSVQLLEKTQKLLKEYDEMTSLVERLSSQLLVQTLRSGDRRSNEDFSLIMEVPVETPLQNLPSIAKPLLSFSTALFYTSTGNYLLLATEGFSAKELAHKYGLKGGGSDQCVQGRDPQVLQIS